MTPFSEIAFDSHRVPIFMPCTFTFLHEPMAAVRLNYNARFVAEEGSPEWVYVRWKDAIRDLFDQFDCRDHTIGVPFDEPLSVSGRFYVSEKPDSKDLDNLVKGILDAMNPSRRKNWADLRTFLWVDDKRIKRFGNWVSVSSPKPRIDIEVTPLWGRVDPMLHYVDGSAVANGGGKYTVNTQLDYPFFCAVPAGVEQPIGDCRLWIVDSLSDGTHVAVASPAQVVFYRELVKLPRVSDAFALAILGIHWNDVLEGLATGNAQFWATEGVQVGRAASAIAALRELFVDPEKRMIALTEKFDQTVFEATASTVSQRLAFPWGTVRQSLISVDLDWRAGLEAVVDAATTAIEVKHATAKRAERNQRTKRAKKPNAARAGKRPAH